MLVFDSNVLVDAANRDSPFHDPCRRQLEAARRRASPAFLPWSVCYEFLRVTAHPDVLPSPWTPARALEFLDSVLASPSFDLLVATERHAAVLAETLADLPDLRGSLMHDVHIAVLMREHGLTQICTRDGDFRRFPFLTVADPTDEALWWPG